MGNDLQPGQVRVGHDLQPGQARVGHDLQPGQVRVGHYRQPDNGIELLKIDLIDSSVCRQYRPVDSSV